MAVQRVHLPLHIAAARSNNSLILCSMFRYFIHLRLNCSVKFRDRTGCIRSRNTKLILCYRLREVNLFTPHNENELTAYAEDSSCTMRCRPKPLPLSIYNVTNYGLAYHSLANIGMHQIWIGLQCGTRSAILD